MSALRPARRDEERHEAATEHALPPQDSPDWLSLQQAACEMGVRRARSARMVRRRAAPQPHDPAPGRLRLPRLHPRLPPRRTEAARAEAPPPLARETNRVARRGRRARGPRTHDFRTRASARSDGPTPSLARSGRSNAPCPPGWASPRDPKDPYARYRWLRAQTPLVALRLLTRALLLLILFASEPHFYTAIAKSSVPERLSGPCAGLCYVRGWRRRPRLR